MTEDTPEDLSDTQQSTPTLDADDADSEEVVFPSVEDLMEEDEPNLTYRIVTLIVMGLIILITFSLGILALGSLF